jgi:hypothetical protein
MNITTLSAKDVQAEIYAVMERDPARTHTHASMAAQIPEIAPLQQIATNMNELARTGVLELVREGWDGRAKTKQYRLPKHGRRRRH